MRRLFASFTLTALLASACAPAAPTPAPAPTAPPAPTATAVPPTATPAPPQPQAPPPSPGQELVTAKVVSFGEGKLVLEGNKTYTISADTRYGHTTFKKPSDLKKGDYLSITAKLGADGALNASSIGIFAAGSTVPSGQRPLPTGDLMTNATVDAFEGGVYTVTFAAGNAKMKLTPDAVVFVRDTGKAEDVKAGTLVTVNVANGGRSVYCVLGNLSAKQGICIVVGRSFAGYLDRQCGPTSRQCSSGG